MVSGVPDIQALTRTRILVVGDVMLDRYWFGAATRISPEAPVPVVKVSKVDDRLGGAANVARNITSIGGHCALLGLIGDDQEASLLSAIVEQAQIDNYLLVDESMRTINKLRVIAQNQQLLRADFETQPSEQILDILVSRFSSLIQQYDAVIFSDYGKGALSHIEQMIGIARSHHKLVFVDPKGIDFERYRGASLITPNLSEFEAVVGHAKSDEQLIEKARQLLESLNLESLLVTLSERGMLYVQQTLPAMHKPARSREVYDVSGAGDTVIAAIAMAKAAKFDDNMSLEIANSAAGVVVSKLGTAVTTLAELEQALKRDYSK